MVFLCEKTEEEEMQRKWSQWEILAKKPEEDGMTRTGVLY